MNLPNKLSCLRMAMIPFFVVFALIEAQWAQIVGLAVFVIASLTDMLDGKIARKYNLVTNFGKFIDPIADKLLVMSALVVLVQQGRMPGWVCIVMLAREFAISGFRLVAAESGQVIAAGWLGKIKTVTQMAAVIALLLLCPVGENAALLGNFGVILANILMYAAAFMTLWSGIDYLWKGRTLFADGVG